jgi:hypothetical protein
MRSKASILVAMPPEYASRGMCNVVHKSGPHVLQPHRNMRHLQKEQWVTWARTHYLPDDRHIWQLCTRTTHMISTTYMCQINNTVYALSSSSSLLAGHEIRLIVRASLLFGTYIAARLEHQHFSAYVDMPHCQHPPWGLGAYAPAAIGVFVSQCTDHVWLRAPSQIRRHG